MHLVFKLKLSFVVIIILLQMVKRRSALFRSLKKMKFIAEEITGISPHFFKSKQMRIIQRY